METKTTIPPDNRSRELQYYYDHKNECLIRQRKYKQMHVIKYTKISGRKSLYAVNKSARPIDNKCPFCNSQRILSWHHWHDSEPNDGFWICNVCHMLITKITNNPKLLDAFIKHFPKDSNTEILKIAPVSLSQIIANSDFVIINKRNSISIKIEK